MFQQVFIHLIFASHCQYERMAVQKPATVGMFTSQIVRPLKKAHSTPEWGQ